MNVNNEIAIMDLHGAIIFDFVCAFVVAFLLPIIFDCVCIFVVASIYFR